MDLNLHSLEEGPSKATLHSEANADIQMTFLMCLEKPAKMWGLLGRMEKNKTQHCTCSMNTTIYTFQNIKRVKSRRKQTKMAETARGLFSP